MVRLFGLRAETENYALQLLSVHLPFPADRPDRLFRVGTVQQPGARGLAGGGVAGLLRRQQLAIRGSAAGVDRLQLRHRPVVDHKPAARRATLCGAHARRRRRSPGARLFQICRLPCRQPQCAVFRRPHGRCPAPGRDILLYLHPDRLSGRRLSRQGRGLPAAALRAVRHLFPASDRGADPSPQGHDPAVRARGSQAAGCAS